MPALCTADDQWCERCRGSYCDEEGEDQRLHQLNIRPRERWRMMATARSALVQRRPAVQELFLRMPLLSLLTAEASVWKTREPCLGNERSSYADLIRNPASANMSSARVRSRARFANSGSSGPARSSCTTPCASMRPCTSSTTSRGTRAGCEPKCTMYCTPRVPAIGRAE